MPAAIIARVLALAAEGFGHRRVAARLAEQGVNIPPTTLKRILQEDRQQRSEETLAPGERLLDEPQRCENGHLITVVPCRSCRAMPNRRLLDRLAAAEKKAEAAGFSMKPARKRKVRSPAGSQRRAKPRPDPLTSKLPRRARARLAAIRARKMRDGEG